MVKAARSSLYKFKLVTTMLAGRVYFLIFINDEDPDSRQAYRKSLLEHSATITYDPADPALLLAGNHILVCNASATTPIVLSTLLRRQPSEHAALNAWGMTFENGSKFKRDVSGPSVRRIEIMQAVLGVVAGAPTETDVLVVRNDLQLAAYHAWRRNPSITAHLATFSNADIAARLAARKNQGRSGGKGQSGKSQGGRGKQQSAGSNKKAAGGQRGAAGSAPSQQVVLDQTQSASEVVINNAQPVAGQDVGAETSGKASTSSVKPQLPVQSCRITSSPSRTIANGKAKQKTVDTATDESSGTASTTSASVPKPRVARNAGKVFKASSSVSATTVNPSSNKRLPADTEDSGPVKKPKHAEALSQHDAVAQESKGDGVVDKSRGADEQVQQVDDVTLDLPAAGLGGDANGIEGGLRADTVTEARVLETETA